MILYFLKRKYRLVWLFMVGLENGLCDGRNEYPNLSKRINKELEKHGLTKEDLNFDSGMHMSEIEQKLGLTDDVLKYHNKLHKKFEERIKQYETAKDGLLGTLQDKIIGYCEKLRKQYN